MSYAAIAALGDQGEDMEAINRYIMTTATRTTKAVQLRDAWLRWYDQLSWYDRNYKQAVYDEARNRRNDFNLANAVTSADRQAVEDVMKKGLTTEEMEGGTRRTTSEGRYLTPEEPLLSTTSKVAIAAAILGGGYLYFAVVRPLVKTYRRVRS